MLLPRLTEVAPSSFTFTELGSDFTVLQFANAFLTFE